MNKSHHKKSSGSLLSEFSLFGIWVASAFLFATIYTFLSTIPGHGPQPIAGSLLNRFLESLYFSIITATSTGFGDIVPHGISRIFAAIQSISAITILALFVVKVTSRRQDTMLDDIHTLSLNASFSEIRQGLFIARRDMGEVTEKIHAGYTPNERDWRNLHTALHQMQTLVYSIGRLYDAHAHREAITHDQEGVLFDAIERTLERVVTTYDIFTRANQIMTRNKTVEKELYKLTELVDDVFPPSDPYTTIPENRDYLEEIAAHNKEIQAHLTRAHLA